MSSSNDNNKRYITMSQRLEEIITLFGIYPDGLTTSELYTLMQERYGYTQTKKNMYDVYLDLLEKGAVKGVSFTRVYRGKHKLVDKRFDGALDKEKKAYIKLALETVEELDDISRHHKEVCSKLHLDELDLPFYIKPEAYQRLNTDEEEVTSLEEAILGDYIIEFRYKKTWYHVAPYRLVNFDGIWYLYGKDMEEQSEHNHKTWMLEFIDDVEIHYTQKHNTSDEEIAEDLDNAYGAKFIPNKEIALKFFVKSEVADLFKIKSHFPRQKILEENDEGILLHSIVSSYEEVEQEIKSWIPHIRVIEPVALKEHINAQVKAFIEELG
jgi:predicted DNA-binding transcriptional regulator YafY